MTCIIGYFRGIAHNNELVWSLKLLMQDDEAQAISQSADGMAWMFHNIKYTIYVTSCNE